MPVPSNPKSDNTIVLEKIENLRCDMAELKTTMKELHDKLTTFQQSSMIDRTQLRDELVSTNKRVDAHDNEIAEITDDIKELKDSIRPLIFANKIMAFVSVTLGTSVIILIWEIVLHKVQLVVP